MAVGAEAKLGGAVAGHVAITHEGVTEGAASGGCEREQASVVDTPHEFKFVEVLFVGEGGVVCVEVEEATLEFGV